MKNLQFVSAIFYCCICYPPI